MSPNFTGVRAKDISDEQIVAGIVYYKFEGTGRHCKVLRRNNSVPGLHPTRGFILTLEAPGKWAQLLPDDFLYIRTF